MTQRLRALVLGAAVGGCFLFFWAGSFMLSWVGLPLVRLASRNVSPQDRDRRCQEVVGRGFRLFIAVMRWLRTLVFVPRGVELQLPDPPFVLISNHPTLIDVTAIMAVYPGVCCVVKTELFRSIWVGPLLRYCGHIEGGSGGPMDGAAVMRQALERLGKGQPVLIFPEGTRSPQNGIRRFNSGAFEIALRAGVPVVPIFLSCDPPALQKGLSWYDQPKQTAQYMMRQLKVPAAGSPAMDSRREAVRFQNLYQAEIDETRRRQASSEAVASAAAAQRLVT